MPPFPRGRSATSFRARVLDPTNTLYGLQIASSIPRDKFRACMGLLVVLLRLALPIEVKIMVEMDPLIAHIVQTWRKRDNVAVFL